MKKWSDLPLGEKIAVGILFFGIVAAIAAVLAIPNLAGMAGSLWRVCFPRPKPVVIGGMDFPEQYTMGEIMAQMLEAKGVEVERNFKESGDLLRNAIEEGNIDCYLEYTGTSYTSLFHQEPIRDQDKIYGYLREEYAKKNIEISKAFRFQNEWAILIRDKDALRLGVRNLSDVVRYAPKWTAGFVPDFKSDPNAAEGLKKTYGLKFKLEREIALANVYDELARGKVNIISGNSTDGELQKLDFLQLKDDRQHFPPYYPIIIARRDTLDRVPALREVMEKLPEKMTLREMRRLNYQISKEPNELKNIVRGWLQANGLISSNSPRRTIQNESTIRLE